MNFGSAVQKQLSSLPFDCEDEGLILISFFLFPVTFYYLSPVLIIEAAYNGIVNGSFIVFSLLFITALVLGRGWCGWLCPATARTGS